jgi:ATP-dependent DNA helicase RecQ
VENHIFQCYEEGLDINLDDLIPKKYENIILEAIERVDHKGKLKPIKEALPSNIEYSAIKAVLYKHKSAS